MTLEHILSCFKCAESKRRGFHEFNAILFYLFIYLLVCLIILFIYSSCIHFIHHLFIYSSFIHFIIIYSFSHQLFIYSLFIMNVFTYLFIDLFIYLFVYLCYSHVYIIYKRTAYQLSKITLYFVPEIIMNLR